jgi:hypothetical protein
MKDLDFAQTILPSRTDLDSSKRLVPAFITSQRHEGWVHLPKEALSR